LPNYTRLFGHPPEEKFMRANIVRISTLAAAALASLPLLGSPASASCDTRHFYNNSPVTFIIQFGGNSTCSVGGSGNHTVCRVPSKQIADLHYSNIDAFPDITVQTPGSKIYPARSFNVQGASCYIDHGSTGNIAVNDPANGDVTTCGRNGWTCSQ
jgi:hypothetical protein